ncbi:MAG: CoA transferase [Chloroflexi bacterium]|nr:CoA transferase [Chloroflexota bacterium]
MFDWTIYALGPFAGVLLGALGAEVIKIEAPSGDPQALERGKQHGLGQMYMNLNLNKRSVTLDLSKAEGRAKALELASRCDVFLNNMRPGTPDRLGLGYETLRGVNRGIVYAVATAWGRSGPMAGVGGVDVLAQAFAGWASITGAPGGRPEIGRHLGYLDLAGSCYVVAAILQALIVRARTGRGQRIDVSLLGSALAMQATRLAEFFATGQVPPRAGSASTAVAPDQALHCQDQRYLAVSVLTETQWQGLLAALGQPAELLDAAFRTNAGRVARRDELAGRLAALFAKRPSAWWQMQLARHAVPHSRFWDFEVIRHHPQVLENGFLAEVETARWGRLFAGAPPWQFESTPAALRSNPEPGGDTAEVLGQLERGELRLSTIETPWPLAAFRKARDSAIDVDPARSLVGLRVLDLTQGIAGPYAGRLLAENGADVLKLEPAAGDALRRLGPPRPDGSSPLFETINHGKRIRRAATELTQATDEARRVAREVDVVLVDCPGPDGEAPWVERAWLASVNSRAIYSAVSPLGARGPLATTPASELVVQAMSDVWGGLGEIGQPPVRLGADMVSLAAGLVTYQGVLAALFWRMRSDQGQRVDTSLLGTSFCLKSYHWGALSEPDSWEGIVHHGWTNPPNHGYRTVDGAVYFVFYRGTEDEFYQLLMELGMGDDVLSDPRFAEGPWAVAGVGRYAAELRPVWEAALSKLTTAQALGILRRHRVDAVPINDYVALVDHPQVAALGSIGRLVAPGGPLRYVRTPVDVGW